MSNSSIFRKLFPKSLSQEVIEVFAGSPAIAKLGRNKEEEYDYLMILTICQDFKKDLFARGIVFTVTKENCVFEQVSEGEGEFTFRCVVRTKFEARRQCWFGMQRFDMGESLGAGVDQYEQIALAIAQTFAYKAMLKRSSMTYGVKDDPEVKQPTGRKSYRERVLDSALLKSGITKEALANALGQDGSGKEKYDEVLALPEKDFNQAIKLILNMEDLTPKWAAAVIDINTKKGQQIVAALDYTDNNERRDMN